MKKTLMFLAVAGLFVAVLVGRAHSASALTGTDINGNPLHEGDLISASASGDPDIYIINSTGYKRLFLNPAIFSFYGHLGGYANVKKVTPAVRDAFITSGLFRNCETNDQKVYATEVTGEDSGVLHHVQVDGSTASAQDSNFFRKVFCINTREENFYPKSIAAYTSLSQIPAYTRKACMPRPACLDTAPRCYPPEPADGWCPVPAPTCVPPPSCVTNAPPYQCDMPEPEGGWCTVSTQPPGCVIQKIECVTVPCDQPLVCPMGTYDHVYISGVSLQPLTVTSPISFLATVKGNLAAPCIALRPLTYVQSGDAIYIVVQVSQLTTSANCGTLPTFATTLTPFERSIVINPVGQTSGVYRVYVNGMLAATYNVPR